MIALVRVLGRLVGIDGRHVLQAIAVPPRMTAVPRRSGGVVGVVSHGAQLVPVVHLQRWLEAEQPGVGDDALPPGEDAGECVGVRVPGLAEATRDTRIVIVARDGQVVGLLVDEVVGLRRCAQQAVERLFHDDRPDELFTHAALVDPGEPPLPLLEPSRLAAAAGAWCAAARIELKADACVAASGGERPRQSPAATVSLAIFRIGDAVVGIPSDDIGELLRTPALRPSPLSRPALRGLCDWRGHLLPVVDLTGALQAVPDAAVAPWMCVVRHGKLVLGVLVHDNFGLTAMATDRLAAASAGRDACGGLARCEVPIEQGILQVLDPRTLMSACPESALSARRGAQAARQAQPCSAKPYLVFEAAGVFATEVDCVQEVLPVPGAVRTRLAAGLPASLSWRGHAVPVRDVLCEHGEPLAADLVTQLIVVARGDDRVAVPIVGVKAMIAARSGTISRLVARGRDVVVVSTTTAEHRASYMLVDLSAQVHEHAALAATA